MNSRQLILVLLIGAASLAVLLLRPARDKGTPTVSVYASADDDVALPIFEAFTKETGIKVEHRIDGEETKTTGLVVRLQQMKDHPDCDVFWNSEQSMTMVLEQKGILQPYVSANAATIPPEFKDPAGMWTGFGCRVRVVVFNINKVKPEEAPKSLDDFANPRWKGKLAIAKPAYGTTRSHLTALAIAIGEDHAFAMFRAWRENGAIIAESNSDVVQCVADGTAEIGLTDSDDAFSAVDRKKPIGFAVLSQTAEWPGAFLIPNTVSMVRFGPHSKEARIFIDYLLSRETEKRLATSGAHQIPVRDVGAKPPPPLDNLKLPMAKVDADKLAANVFPLGERILRILTGEEK